MKRLTMVMSAVILFSWSCLFSVRALQDEVLARVGRGIISDVAFSPDSSMLAVLTSKGIYFHNPADFTELAFIDMGLPPLYGGSISFSPDGKLLASPTRGMTEAVVLWNTETLEKVAEIKTERYNGYVGPIEFSPDGKSIAFGGDDGKIRLLDVVEGKEIGVLDTDDNIVEAIHFSPDGSMLGSVSLNTAELKLSVKLWDIAAHEAIRTFRFGRNIAFSPDGALFAVGEKIAIGGNGTIRLYDMEQDEQGVIDAGHFIRPLHFSPDSKLLMTGDRQGINLWDVEDLEAVDNIAIDLEIWNTQFSPDGRFLVCADFNKVIIWDMIAQRRIESSDEYMGNVQSVAISSDSRWLACGDPDSVKLWDLETYELLSIFRTTRLMGFIPYSVAISPDNHLLAAGSWNHDKVMIWDIEDEEEIAVIDVEAPEIPYVHAVAFSPDGELLAFGGSGGLQLWNIETKKEIQLDGNPGFVYSIDFSPDGKFLVSGGDKEAVHIWDLEKQKKTGELKQESVVYSLAYSPDGRWLAAGLHANKVELWDMQSLKEVKTLTTESPVSFVSFSNNGCLLAVQTWRDRMVLWDVAGREKVATSPVHTYTMSASFSPDDRFLACGLVGEVVLWDIEPYADICGGQSVDPNGKLAVSWGGIRNSGGNVETQSDLALGQNYPNPFNPGTWIPFGLSGSEHVIIRIYSSAGQLVRTLDLGHKESGAYLGRTKAAYWDGKNQQGESLGSGVYFYQLMTDDDFSVTKKMVVVR